jgi:hypothetical protein
MQATYGKLPLHFETNQGQADEQVHFFSRGSGYTLFLASTEAVLALHKPHKNSLTPIPDPLASPQPHKNSLFPVSDSLASPQPPKNSLTPGLSTSPPPWRGRTKEGGIKGSDPEPTQELPRPRLGGEGQGEGVVLRMKLVGANPNPRACIEDNGGSDLAHRNRGLLGESLPLH